MRDDLLKALIDEETTRSATDVPLDLRTRALDKCIGEASMRFLHAAACLSAARMCLRTGDEEGGICAANKYREHLLEALAAIESGSALYAMTPARSTIH